MAIFAILTTFFSTFAGGLIGLKFRDKLHIILGFTAGVVLGVIAFDILPEIVDITAQFNVPFLYAMVALVIGFLLFHFLEKVLLIHTDQEETYDHHHHPILGLASAIALVAHSFLDGVGIGLGFQVSTALGLMVAFAIIAHDFADGLNTVSLMLVHHNRRSHAMALLIADALAPIAGGIFTMLFTIPPYMMVLYLGFFAGFLLYICASEILPEAHRQQTSIKSLTMTILGAFFIFCIVTLSR